MPRTVNTRRLETFKYQFYQWFYVDKYIISEVTALFHWLFKLLHDITGEEHGATKEQWLSRQREWNKKWQLRKSDPCVPAPEDLVGQKAWFRKSDDGLLLLNTSLLPAYTRHKTPGFIRKVDLGDATIGHDSGLQQSSQDGNTANRAFGHSPSIADHHFGPGSIGDSFVNTPDLHENPAKARKVHGSKPQASPHAYTNNDPSAGRFPPTSYCSNTEAQVESEASKNRLLYLWEGSASPTSSAHPPKIGSERPDNAMDEPNSNLDGFQPPCRECTQETSFTTTLPTRNSSNRECLAVNHAETVFGGMMADSATLDVYQPTNDAASYSTGAVLTSSNTTSLHRASVPYFGPPATSPGPLPDNHPSVHDVGLAPDNYGSLVSAARWNFVPPAQGTAASHLMVSPWSAQLIETNVEAFPHTHIIGPYPRLPSNQPSFLQYDGN